MTVEELIVGQRVYLCFEGANQETNVFVNGKLVGNHDCEDGECCSRLLLLLFSGRLDRTDRECRQT